MSWFSFCCQGVTLLPGHVALMILLCSIRAKFPVEFVVRSHALEGPTVTGLRLGGSKQEVPLTLEPFEDPASCEPPATLRLTFEHLVYVNHFREVFSAFLEQAEKRMLAGVSRPSAGNRRSRDQEEKCLFFDRDDKSVRALHNILSVHRQWRGHRPASPDPAALNQLFYPRQWDKMEQDDWGILRASSYDGVGSALGTLLLGVSPKKLLSVGTTPIFAEQTSSQELPPFLVPITLAGVADEVRRIRLEVSF